MTTFAFIDPTNGRVNFTVKPSDPTKFVDGSVLDGRLIKILPDGIDSTTAIESKRWNGTGFEDMPPKPFGFYYWSTSRWVFDAEEFKKALRETRNSALTRCDWTQLPDVSIDDNTLVLWNTYRRALRDLPDNLTGDERSLEDVDWPTPP